MDKKNQIRVNIFISIVILLGFISVGLTSYYRYSSIIKDDIVNISKLTATSIYSDIRNELTKPIFVSLTMANDSFLKNWLKAEGDGDDSLAHRQALQDYLLGLKKKYDYHSVFLISENSKIYYHYQGINKVISPQNEHDQWYYSFIDKNMVYDLDIDSDEANHNRLSVFVNCRILDDNGKLMGVTGVGVEINQVQALLQSFQRDFILETMLFHKDGSVQIHPDTDFIGKQNVFDSGVLKENKEAILDNQNSLEVYQFQEQQADGYIITRYIEDLDWYLLVKKDTSILVHSFRMQMLYHFMIFLLVAFLVLLLVNRIIRQKDKVLLNMANIDSLTNLPNRRSFNEKLESIIQDTDDFKPFYAFVFDIDNFKTVNDQNGHLMGDKVVRRIGQIASEVFESTGLVTRWGGDEFAGFIYGDKQQAVERIELFFQRISEDSELASYSITVSLGASCARKLDTEEALIHRADKALYTVKETGKNNYIILEN